MQRQLGRDYIMGDKLINVEETGSKKRRKKKQDKVRRILSIDSLKPMSKVVNKLELKKLRANMVYTGRVVNIYVPDNDDKAIEIESSWIELCLLLLGFLDMKTDNKMLKVLVEKKVLSSGFDITSNPSMTMTKSNKEVYSIPGTGLYLITTNNPFIMLEAIKNIVSAIGIKDTDFKLDVVPMEENELAAKLATGDTELATKQMYIEDASRIIKEQSKIESISIEGICSQVNKFSEAVEFMMMYICNNYTEEEIRKAMVCNIQTVGISDTKELEGVETSSIENTELYLYMSQDNYKFIEYLYKLSKFLNIPDVIVEITQEYFV